MWLRGAGMGFPHHAHVLVTPKPLVPAACPIGRQTEGTHGHSRTARYTSSPAYRHADPPRKPTFQTAGQPVR
jgi:hypothetical protein